MGASALPGSTGHLRRCPAYRRTQRDEAHLSMCCTHAPMLGVEQGFGSSGWRRRAWWWRPLWLRRRGPRVLGRLVEVCGVPWTGSEEEGWLGRLEFERGSEAAMAAEEEGEGTGGGVGWSRGAREGEREVGDERRLGGGLIRARPGGAVGGAHGHGPWRCQRPRGRSGACLGCSWSWSRPRGEERGSRASSRRSRTSVATGGRERRSGTHVRGRRREKEEGADRLACPGRRGGLMEHKGEGPRWSEASGRTRLHCPGAL